METSDGEQFPLLVKFLFAGDDLSVQVHPDDAYAAAHPDAHLKNECWTILHAEPDARLLAGLNDGVTRGRFEQAVKAGDLEPLLRAVPARVGTTHYLPSGTVHALGAGTSVAEIQTPSDTTYRVYDFNRTDPSTGETRRLHVDRALECINFDDPNPPPPAADPEDGDVIVTTPQFTVTHRTTGAIDDGFAVLVGIGGAGTVAGRPLNRGDVLLLPHDREAVEVTGDATYLEVTAARILTVGCSAGRRVAAWLLAMKPRLKQPRRYAATGRTAETCPTAPAMSELLSAPVLFFLLGIFACLVRSDLEFPQPIPKLLSLYLLVAIGLKGGVELRAAEASFEVLAGLGGGRGALGRRAVLDVLRAQAGGWA